MEREGFSCKLYMNDVLRYEEVETDGSVTKHVLHGVDFLQCNRSEQDGLVTVIYSIALLIENGRVERLISWDSFVGP